MSLPKSISENLNFLIVEVNGQLVSLKNCFDGLNISSEMSRILERSGYASNLHQRIKKSSEEQLTSGSEQVEPLTLRAIESIAANLDKLTELCRSCVQQIGLVDEKSDIDLSQFSPLIKAVIRGTSQIEEAFINNDSDLALQIGETEEKIDSSYHKILKDYVKELKKSERTKVLVNGLFIAYVIEQMGETLLEISEAIISNNFGQPLNKGRLNSLKSSIKTFTKKNIEDVEINPLADTKSGSGISAIKEDDETLAVFKDGDHKKLKEEKAGVESWHEIFPGLAPKIIKYKKNGHLAALLIEHLEGMTFEQIILQNSEELRVKSLKKLTKTLKKVWTETQKKKSAPAMHMTQLQKRLQDVFAVHPSFKVSAKKVCGLNIPSYCELVEKVAQFEEQLTTPFSIYIHGDFNVDNIIYEPHEESIKFIDLHRSKYMDYTQDITVFAVSNFRLQVFEKQQRMAICRQISDFISFARSFAEENKDKHFEYRLALGLARSMMTSTRFIKDKEMSKLLMFRSRYLLEKISALNLDEDDKFKVPVEEIFNV